MKEIWRDIVGYEGLYQVSNTGKVRNKKGRILKLSIDIYGYAKIQLCKNGKHKWHQVHRLVAETFIPNTNNYPCVNHKSEIKTQNNVENLEWCTVKYNNNFNGRQQRIALKRQVIVLQIDKNTNEIIKEWSSITEAEKQLGLSSGHICLCCKGKRNICGGYKWQYKKGDC